MAKEWRVTYRGMYRVQAKRNRGFDAYTLLQHSWFRLFESTMYEENYDNHIFSKCFRH